MRCNCLIQFCSCNTLLRLHGQFCVVSLPFLDDKWSGSERDLLSHLPERANALAVGHLGRKTSRYEVDVISFARY